MTLREADVLVRNYVEALLANNIDDAAEATKGMVDYVMLPSIAQPESEPSDRADLIMKLRADFNEDRVNFDNIKAAANMLEADARKEPIFTVNGYQLREALEFLAPDGADEQLEQEVCIQYGPERTHDEGTDPAGLYCWLEECPEEGSIALTGEPAPSIVRAQQVACKCTEYEFCDPCYKKRKAQQVAVPTNPTDSEIDARIESILGNKYWQWSAGWQDVFRTVARGFIDQQVAVPQGLLLLGYVDKHYGTVVHDTGSSERHAVYTLSAAPQPAYVPLTDAEIESLDCVWLKDLGFDECEVDQASVMRFARAIEQAVRGKT